MDVRRRFSTQSCDDNYGQTAGIQYYKDLSYEVHTSPAMLRSDVALSTTKVVFALVLNCPCPSRDTQAIQLGILPVTVWLLKGQLLAYSGNS